MVKVKKLKWLILCLIIAVATFAAGFFAPSLSVANADTQASPAAAQDYSYGFRFDKFHVTYDIHTDRTWHVKHVLDVFFTGRNSTGFVLTVPCNDGDRVRNVSVKMQTGVPVEYSVEAHDGETVYIDIGSMSNKTNQTLPVVVEYDYAVTKPVADNIIYLNAIGFQHQAEMRDVKITLNLPNGLKNGKNGVNCYIGAAGNDAPSNDAFSLYGNILIANVRPLNVNSGGINTVYEGVSFALEFDDGVLSVKQDMTPFWIIIVACVVLAILFAVKFLVFREMPLAPVSNTMPPNDMDPLIMGKLIDNHASPSDVTSLIYYWANKGYLKIDMTDEKDIVLVKILKKLPSGSPDYQDEMYNKLFIGGDLIHINNLKDSFYPTVQSVTQKVNSKTKELYSGTSFGVSILFAVIGWAITVLTPLFMAFSISPKLFFIGPVVTIIPAALAYILTLYAMYSRLKIKKPIFFLIIGGGLLLTAVTTLIYAIAVPSYIIEVLPKCLLCALGMILVMLSPMLLKRTDKYSEQLNHIVGFKQFIEYAEKEKLELMLEENPQYYYEVLPYAQVLGVSDKWQDKFKALTIQPPQWMMGTTFTDIIAFSFMHAILRNMTAAFVSNMVTRPNISGGSGFHGSFGGFSGGGHGGGGSFGR